MVETDILIIGGGLSGLRLAEGLVAQGQNFALVEARDRLGGRILTETQEGAGFDLGPAWFWPGQPRIASLIERLGLAAFDQYSQGDLIFEDERGQVQRGRGYASMQGSFRLEGGLGSLVYALADRASAGSLHLETPISELTRTTTGVLARAKDGRTFVARRVVLALPPRVATRLTYAPGLSPETHRTLEGVATWMAGQAKAVFVYERPFWREAGLSGDAMSRFGPMVEIHDASPASGGPYALFGFIGVAPDKRRDAAALQAHMLAQLGRLFGSDAAAPLAVHLKDWADDPYTATEADRQPLYAHPTYGRHPALEDLWEGRLIFSGTELAPEFGGYLEGALEAAEYALAQLDRIKA